jgi:DnaK suppressor protein
MADVAELLERLKLERDRLERELAQLNVEEKQADEQREGSPFGKREEGATETFEMEKRMALERKLSGSLAEVKHAMEKIDSGTYGICDSCKNPIEQARMEALPQANLCLKCKSQQMKSTRAA